MEKSSGKDKALIKEYPGGDMWGRKYPGIKYDFAHPNDRGNLKMAEKWLNELKPFMVKYKHK